MTDLDRADIQGIVLSGYGHLTCAAYLLLRVRDAVGARGWLASVATEITNASGKQEGFSLNLALTYEGLRALGLDADALATFPVPFTEGMASPKRSHILGDTNKDAPANWEWGGEKNPVHILLLVFGADEDALAAQLKVRREELARFDGGVEEVLQLSAGRQDDSREHFGFNDGIAQPVIEGGGRKQSQLRRTDHATEVKPGEFVLGYVNEYDVPADCPTVDPARDPQELLHPYEYPPQLLNENAPAPPPRRNLGINGSYLVFRQLEQHVPAFWNFVAEAARKVYGAESGEASVVRLASKFVGRWPGGAPLVKSPDRDDPQLATDNNFGYAATDKQGLACPIGSHIRRSNPRDSLGDNPKAALRAAHRHRLMRRGRSYGHRIKDKYADDKQPRGLHFICLNSELERQFEFVQQTWLNNPVFGGLYNETDPLVGNQDKDKCAAVYTVPGDPLRVRVHDLCSFLSVRGGAYFFLPGLRALRYLGNL